MPLLGAIKSRAELYEEGRQNPLVQALEQANLDEVPFFKQLSDSSLRQYARIDVRWAELYASEKKKGNPWGITEKINVGITLPPRQAFIAFAMYLALTTQGLLGSQYAAKSTIKGYMNTLWGAFRRNALLQIPSDYRQQTIAFIDSADLEKAVPLVTRMREKPIASTRDITIFIRAVWEDRNIIRTTRMRIQLCLFILLSSLSTERPGAIVESSCYRGTNQALKWDDIEVHIIPNPDDPNRPYIIIRVRINLLKFHRKDDSAYKDFILFPEPNPNRAMCPISLIIALGIEDKVWKNITTADDIFHPKIPPTDHHQLVTIGGKRPVLRREVFRDGIWITHAELALPYDCMSRHLRQISLSLGWLIHLTSYCLRRGASNRASKVMSEEERTSLLGHIKNAMEFVQSYQSRQVSHDLGAILHGRDQDHKALKTAQVLTDMSSRSDPRAPLHLPPEAAKDLLQDEDLIEMRKQREKLKETADDVYKRLDEMSDAADENSCQERIALQAQADILSARLSEFDRIYKNIVRRNAYHRLPQSRKEYFAGHSEPQLTGQAAPQKTKMHTQGQENTDRISLSIPGILATDPLDQIMSLYINGTQEFSSITDSVLSFVNAVIGLPARPFATCYPGEFPTEDNTCPVCDEVCSKINMRKGIGSHIHSCITKQMCADAQKKAEGAFTPTPCSWHGCIGKRNIYNTRKDFITHVAGHCSRLVKPSTTVGELRCCMWKDTVGFCGVEEHEDWLVHFATEHGINLQSTIAVDYCTLCSQFFVDNIGDRSVWEAHCMEHYDNLFRVFEDRAEEDQSEFPLNADAHLLDNPRAIQFEHGSSFASGIQPEIHGHFADRIVLVPARCPFCLYDDEISTSVRMKEWLDADTLQRHVNRMHLDELDQDIEHQCPIPSCGIHKFSYPDLLEHLVSYHRLAICGTTGHRIYRRLLLPVVEGDMVIEHSKRKRKPKSSPLTDDENEPPSKKTKKKSRDAYWCFGCSEPFQNIGRHLRAAKLDSKCRRVGEYQWRLATGEFSGDRLSWVFHRIDR
ncbi:hypothetical protein EV421DRAFT_707129 [Armillaria borealis]|uniref:C2H2-type domain-containing protein n=1 Tax=Armillaria borealis TaxID=47425 RepID=A0AA39N1I7_9AGAR|nr:hypothetical protein EV421DRAFT_707129 [Armillaria borealis]